MYVFGDGFDCYASATDPGAGFWDASTTGGAMTLVAGRFTGSQAISFIVSVNPALVKNSNSNDAVHHIVCAFRQTATLTGTNLGAYFQFSDGVTNQCCIVFRGDGTILLTSATPAGTVLATWTAGVTAANVWIAYEFEVVIHPTAGSFTARRNGNTSNDFTATALNTRPGTNSYANKLTIGQAVTVNAQQFDDILWRSDPSSVPWIGDVRAYTRMPATDLQTQWTRCATALPQTPFSPSISTSFSAGVARYGQFTATYDGTIGALSLQVAAAFTGNVKCTIFASNGTAPTTVLGSATPVNNPVLGANIFTFPTPVPVTKGVQYWVGFDCDTTTGTVVSISTSGPNGCVSTTPYASFPVASPGVSGSQSPCLMTVTITLGSNNCLVNEAIQDGTASYLFDANPGDSDFYGISAMSGTPIAVIAVTTRAYLQKSDAGTRNAAAQLRSGGTTVQTASTALSTTWTWLYRVDLVDPATGSAWTPAATNNVAIGVTVTA